LIPLDIGVWGVSFAWIVGDALVEFVVCLIIKHTCMTDGFISKNWAFIKREEFLLIICDIINTLLSVVEKHLISNDQIPFVYIQREHLDSILRI
jgi:radical SAM superfamily enzyme